MVILHGVLGSSANWKSLANRFGKHRTVYTLDLRNHGQSPWSDKMHYADMADDVAEFIDPLDHASLVLIGHSMGGKVAMAHALQYSDQIDALIVADIAPVTYQHNFTDLIDPMLALDLTAISARSDADEKLSNSVSNQDIRAFLLHNLAYDKKDERWSWRPNLKVIRKAMSRIAGFDISRRGSFDAPALFVFGEQSDYVLAQHHRVIGEYFKRASYEQIADAGHWLHAEQPSAFVRVCERFLSENRG